MIELHVEKYCHNCPRFEPELETNAITDYFGDMVGLEHRIYCANRDVCSGIRKFFEEREKNAN